MKWKVIPALLASALSFAPVSLQGQVEASPGGEIRVEPSIPGVSGNRASKRNALQNRAQAAYEGAVKLGQNQTASDLHAALKAFQDSAQLFKFAHQSENAAHAHFRAGEIYSTLGRYGLARYSFQTSLKIAQDPELRCRALSRIARTYAITGPFSLGDRYSNEAMGVCYHLSEGGQAEALEARGEVLDFAGEKLKSDAHVIQARDLFAAAHDINGQARAVSVLAYHALFSGDQTQGLKAANQALQLWSSTANRHGIARMRSILGTFAIERGDFETAQCNYRAASPVFREIGNKDDEGGVLNGLGFVSREMGDWQNSLHYYETARANFASVQDLSGEIEAIRGMGRALIATKNFSSLSPLYESELEIARHAGDPIGVAQALEDMGTAYEAQEKYAEAGSFYRRSLDVSDHANDIYTKGDVLIRLGYLQAELNKFAQAIASLESANNLAKQTGRVEKIAKIHYELASVYLKMSRPQDALAAIEKTIEIIDKQRVSISHFDSRASYFASVHQYYALYVHILMLLHQQEPAAGFAEKAFDASERSKVRSLLDLVTTSSQDAPCDELLAQQLNTEKDQDDAVKRVNLVTTASAGSTLTMAEVQEQLESDDTVLAEYALGDEKSYLWTIGRQSVTSHELPPAQQIKRLVEAYRRSLLPPAWKAGESAAEYQARARVIDNQLQVSGQQLSRWLLGPLTGTQAKRILIVPDGSLQYLPFAALPFPGAAGRAKPLVSAREIVTLPSASVLAGLRRAAANKRSPTATAAIFADPVFEPDDPRVSGSQARAAKKDESRPAALTRAIQDLGKGSYIPRLTASRDEANAIATVLRARDPRGVRVALDFDANRNFVVAEGLTQFRLLHFATHGLVDTRYPERSGLILSLIDKHGRKGDGYLRLNDVYNLKLSADLVVLSACESALGQDLSSEGIIGLPRAFLHAGAKSVIASLWKVNDQATAKLMADLYARIERGETPSSALRSAQLDMVNDDQWSKPYYWAAFVLQGDYR